MLLRKRAWDIMREEFPTANQDATLTQVIKILNEARKESPDMNFVAINNRRGGLKGVISMWNIIQSLGPVLLKEVSLGEKEINWDKAFKLACQTCSQVNIEEYMQKDVPKVRPNDPLARILEIFIDYRRGRAAVEEGGKVIGFVLLADLYKEIARDVQ